MLQIQSRALCLAALLTAPVAAFAQSGAQLSDGPVFSADRIAEGIRMTARECAAYRSTVYVTAQGSGICFRYYLSTAGGSSAQAVYFLSGDKDQDSYAFEPATFDRTAALMSTEYKMPAVYLARMGLDGSSGWHKYRRTWFEVEATHLAIDAINARHGFQTVHVMGQSGGGHLTGSLVGTRSDVGCAIPGSGRLAFDSDYVARQQRQSADLRHYNPHDNLSEVIRHSSTARILVVTDPGDQRVPAHMQTAFVRDVQRAGGRIAQFFITATDSLSHGATPYVRRAMAACLANTSDGEIGTMLAHLSEQRWHAHLAAERNKGAGGRTPVASNAPPAIISAPSARPQVYAARPMVAHTPAPEYRQPQGSSFRVAGSPPPPPPGR